MSAIDKIRADIRAMSAYSVQDAAGLVKLDAMENPWPLPSALQARVAEELKGAAFNRYPDPHGIRLKEALRRAFSIHAEAEILLGNGSDEIIAMLCQAVAAPGAILLSIEPSFVMFQVLAKTCGLGYRGVTLNADFSLPLERMLEAIRETSPALIFVANPNNPTGNVFPKSDLQAIIEAAPGLVVIDEAYFPFTDANSLSLISAYPQLLVMRTLSKLGLAGVRLGFLVGQAPLIHEIDKIRLPYNVPVASQIIARAVLDEGVSLVTQTTLLRRERERLLARYSALAGLHVFPSEANFLLLRVSEPEVVFDGLKQRGILIKNLSRAHALLSGCLRVTVGTPEENDRCFDAISALLQLSRQG
jgi:histidinol-phosphate aminotransferase